MAKVLVIDDDRAVLHMVQRSLGSPGVDVITASTVDEGLRHVQAGVDTVLLDIILPRMSGMEVFERIRALDSRLPVIFITAGASSDTAIEAMQKGAYDYLAKPLDLPQLNQLVAKALDTRRLMHVPVALPILQQEKAHDEGDVFVGRSPRMLEVFKAIGQVAKQNVTVLIRGESGTGKELVARAIYQFSNRATRPFMAVNCAALSETLLESELFGHEKGSFTGAERRRIGKFEQCTGGTLFMDEVGDMSPLLQGKVLRLLQEQKFERVGGNETIETDVRLIAATNRPLEEMVEQGKFRGDLFYRLNVVTITLPPLRERSQDVALLLQHYLTQARQELDKPDLEGISPEALEKLLAYDWPGNVRELQSIVRQCVLKATGPVIVPDFLPTLVMHPSAARKSSLNVPAKPVAEEPAADAPPIPDPLIDSHASGIVDLDRFISERLEARTNNLYAEALEFMERHLFTKVLQHVDGNQTKTSEILGITRGKVRDRIAAFGISVDKTVSMDHTSTVPAPSA